MKAIHKLYNFSIAPEGEQKILLRICTLTLQDRDLNASINIKKQGLKIGSGLGTNSDSKQKRREASPLGESMNSEAHSSPLEWMGSSQNNR